MSKRTIVLALGVIMALVLGWQVAAFANHYGVSLEGSKFEIENSVDPDGSKGPLPPPAGANLKVDVLGNLDWVNVTEIRVTDAINGTGDNSFTQGTKEDSTDPVIEADGIPPNKSDLRHFGVYLETNAAGRFLHVYWHRVQDPTGTTNMDFEFNKNVCEDDGTGCSDNGITPERSSGDILIQYDLANGGTNPELFVSKWLVPGDNGQCQASNSKPCWGKRTNFTTAGDATGSINNEAIVDDTNTAAVDETDGLGVGNPKTISARTFGEASIDFNAIAGNDPCVGFGSAYLKSRSSDSFTAALKDFTPPEELNINNCGALKILKNSTKGGAVNKAGAVFSYDDNDGTADPVSVTDDTTSAAPDEDADVGEVCVSGLTPGAYTVSETSAPTGYGLPTGSQTVTVVAGTNCGSNPPTGTAVATFIDPPLADIQVRFRDGGSGETSLTTTGDPKGISCNNTTGTTSTADTTGWDDTTTITGVAISPSPKTITCTIVIDP